MLFVRQIFELTKSEQKNRLEILGHHQEKV